MQQKNRQGTPAYDGFQPDKQINFNPSRVSTSMAAKQAVQNLYKIQLDTCLHQRQVQRQNQKLKLQEQKRQFNLQVEKGKQAEKMKQVSYKNYYNMLMNNQAHNKESYISPFSMRQNMKESLVNKNVEEQRRKYQLYQIQAKKMQKERKISYKNELLNQIQDKKRRQLQLKNQITKQKKYFQDNYKFPEEIKRYEKEKGKQEKQKYRQDLDKVKQTRYKSHSNAESANFKPSTQFHNILTNPVPYNMQNPYILQQMGAGRSQSYLASKGVQNLKLS